MFIYVSNQDLSINFSVIVVAISYRTIDINEMIAPKIGNEFLIASIIHFTYFFNII